MKVAGVSHHAGLTTDSKEESMITFKDKPAHKRFQDLERKRYNRWRVIGYAGRLPVGLYSVKTFWWCRCRCGNVDKVTAQQLVEHKSESCGCLNRERTGDAHRTHGQSQTVEYKIWKGMRRRCECSDSRDWPDYGGRGIRVCKRWRSFEAFLADLGPRPGKGYSIERRNNDKGYSPDNCYWATQAEQNRNKRTTRKYTHGGVTLCLKDWSDRCTIRYDKLRKRLTKYGWAFSRAISVP